MSATIEEIKSACREAIALGEKATEGPWSKGESFAGATVYAGSLATKNRGLVATFDSGDYARSKEEGHANAAFIAHVRQFTPEAAKALLGVIEDMEENQKSASALTRHRAGLTLKRICAEWKNE